MAVNKLNARVCTVLHSSKEYDVLIGVSDLDELDNILQEWAMAKWGVLLDLPSALISNKAITEVLTSLDVDEYFYLQSPVAAYMEMPRYSGISGDLPIFPTILTGGKYIVPTCLAFLWSEPGFTGYFGEYIIEESQAFTLSTGINHIGIHFNVGAPAYFLTDDLSDFDYSSKIPVVTVLNFASGLYVIPFGQSGYGLAEKSYRLKSIMKGLEIIDPYVITATDLYVQLGELLVSNGMAEIVCPAVDTEVTNNDLYLHYKDAQSVWQTSKKTQIENTQYQGASGLAGLQAGEFVINNIFRVVDENKLLLFNVLSNKFATLQSALNSAEVTLLPASFKGSAVLVARAIVEYNSTVPVVQVLQKNTWAVS
jgi:hypothetical protein